MPVIALILIILHPVLLSWGSGSWELITSLELPWYILLGKAGLLLLLINVIASFYRKNFSMGYQSWRTIHNILGLLIILIVFLHSRETGHDIQNSSMQILWIILLLGGAGFYFYHKIVHPYLPRLNKYKVTLVNTENKNVTTLRLEPENKQSTSDHYPGQFHCIKLFRYPGLPREEHYFTISSDPHQRDFLESTIKASGDYTRQESGCPNSYV